MRRMMLRPAWAVLVALPLWLAPAAWSQAEPPSAVRGLPALGDGAEMGLSDERRLGDQIVRTLYRSPDYLDDPVLHDYLQALWQPLVQSAQHRGDMSAELTERFAWEILLGRDRSINAFALPGGYLGLHLGLIAAATTPDELAAVLAHELGHVSQRHIARLMTRQQQQAPWLIGAMILGALAANAANNADIANAAIAGGQALAVQSRLNFSRDMEREADRIGFGLMTEAGFDGMGFVTLFEKLLAASRLNDDGSFPYLRSHPLSTERKADMAARVPELRAGGRPPSTGPVALEYHAMMAARARVLSETSAERLQSWVQTLNASSGAPHDPTVLGQRYAATLAAARLRDAAGVREGVRLLHAGPPSDENARQAAHWLHLEALLLLPTTALDEQQHQELRALMQKGLQSNRRAGLLLGAQATLRADAAAQRAATLALQTWTSLNPRDALAWQTLAALHMAQQQSVRAARAEAEARWAHFDIQGALERLRAAQQMARNAPAVDHIELSILDARVRQAEAVLREQLQNPARDGR